MKLNQLLFNEAMPEIPREEPENEIFGSWFNPSEREIPVNEPDTELETKLIRALKWWFWEGDQARLQDNIKTIKYVLANHKYEQIFDPGNIEVYRGMYFETIDELLTNFDQETKNLLNNNQLQNTFDAEEKQSGTKHISISIKLNGTLFPASGLLFQSWTTRKETAHGFSSRTSNKYGIVITASTKNNLFFGKPKILGSSVDGGLSEEYETISIGPVKFNKLEIKQYE